MSFSLQFWYFVISLLLQIKGGLTLKCYYCNTRDNEGCEDIRFGQNNTFLKDCRGPCAIVKGQWGILGEPKYMIWRGCSKIWTCTQATGMCCTCSQNYCNYDNECRGRGNVIYPGVIIYFAQLYIGVLPTICKTAYNTN